MGHHIVVYRVFWGNIYYKHPSHDGNSLSLAGILALCWSRFMTPIQGGTRKRWPSWFINPTTMAYGLKGICIHIYIYVYINIYIYISIIYIYCMYIYIYMYVYVYVYIYCIYIYIYIHANIYLTQYINQLISGGAWRGTTVYLPSGNQT